MCRECKEEGSTHFVAGSPCWPWWLLRCGKQFVRKSNGPAGYGWKSPNPVSLDTSLSGRLWQPNALLKRQQSLIHSYKVGEVPCPLAGRRRIRTSYLFILNVKNMWIQTRHYYIKTSVSDLSKWANWAAVLAGLWMPHHKNRYCLMHCGPIMFVQKNTLNDSLWPEAWLLHHLQHMSVLPCWSL